MQESPLAPCCLLDNNGLGLRGRGEEEGGRGGGGVLGGESLVVGLCQSL